MELFLQSALISSFIAGALMFFAPCTFPLIPGFFASLTPKIDESIKNHILSVSSLYFKVLIFCLGFTTTFAILGFMSGLFGSTLLIYKELFARIGGVIVIFLGFSLLLQKGIRLNFLRHFSIPQSWKNSGPFIYGVIFGFGWAPCSGPLLLSILVLAAAEGTALKGFILLLIFSLGLAIPFLIAGLLYTKWLSYIYVYERYRTIITSVSGILLVSIGILLVFSQMILMTHAGFFIYSIFGFVPQCTLF